MEHEKISRLKLRGVEIIEFEHVDIRSFKYRLTKKISCQTGIRRKETVRVGNIVHKTTGTVDLLVGYLWNGSNFVADTDEDMFASAFHDALCILRGLGLIPKHRMPDINDLYANHMRIHGMSAGRVKLRRAGLRLYWLRIRKMKRHADLKVEVRKSNVRRVDTDKGVQEPEVS